MTQIRAKQIIKLMSGAIRLNAVSVTGSSAVVTSQITTALSTAGDGATSVPLQVASAGTMGVITTAPLNRCEVYDSTSKGKIASSTLEVYARLTEASGVYTLSFFTLDATGAENAYSFAAATAIDFEFNYRFDFNRFPTDAIVGIQTRNVSQDPTAASSEKTFREQLTVTATNTVSNLTKTPVNATAISLQVNGLHVDAFGGAAARFSVNLSTKAITWSAANAGYSLETTDRVIAIYTTNE